MTTTATTTTTNNPKNKPNKKANESDSSMSQRCVYTDAAGWQHKRKRSEGGKIKKIWTRRILKRTRRKIRPIQEPRKGPLNSVRSRSSWASSLAVDYSGGGGVVVSSLGKCPMCSALLCSMKGKRVVGGRNLAPGYLRTSLPTTTRPRSWPPCRAKRLRLERRSILPFFLESQFLPLYFSYSSIGTMLLYGIYSDAIIDNP